MARTACLCMFAFFSSVAACHAAEAPYFDASLSLSSLATIQPSEPAPDIVVPSATPDPPKLLSRGSFAFQSFGSATLGANDNGDLYLAHIGAGYFLLDGLSVNFEGIAGVGDVQERGDVAALGFDLLLRWHVLHRAQWSVYFEGGAGMIWTNDEFPDGGTRHNFTPQFGVGATISLIDQLHVMGGARWHHISNAGKSGGDSNPGYDGLMMYLGVMVPF